MNSKTLKLDCIDRKLLDILQKNSNLTAKELAFKLHLSQTPVYERIKKLEKIGIIRSYVALLNPNLVNRSIIVFINITVKDHSKIKREHFVTDILEFKEISEFYNTSGTYDFVAKGRFSTIESYRDFLVNKLSNISNISDIDSHIVLEEIKYSTEIPLT